MVCDPEDPNCNQEARLEILQDNKQDPQQLLINEESILDSNLDGIVINSPDISNTPTVESDGTLENLYNNENTNASPPPLEVRAITIVFALPFFNIADITLAELTVMVAQAALADPEPATKLLLTVGELVIVGADLALAYGEVSYAHWVVTGEWINSWDDLSNWTIMP
jgi:hypothetical protein